MPGSHLYALERRPDASGHGQPEAEALQLADAMTLQRYEKGCFTYSDVSIAVETDLRLRVEGLLDKVMSRTPGDDMNLVVGYLFSRSMIKGPEDVRTIGFGYQGMHHVDVSLVTTQPVRRLYPCPRPVQVAPEALFGMKETFERRQNLFKNTGSTHAAALFTQSGELMAFGEDVGRHNAFDKAIGRALMEGTLERVVIAMLSSRLALELATKASTANIPILCGFSAATSSGVQYAEKHNVTLVGRLRGNSFNVYSNGWRIRS